MTSRVFPTNVITALLLGASVTSCSKNDSNGSAAPAESATEETSAETEADTSAGSSGGSSTTAGSTPSPTVLPSASASTSLTADPTPTVAPEASVDLNLPASPTVEIPISSPLYTSSSNFTISGECITDHLIQLSGADSQSATCSGSRYSFAISKSLDDIYDFQVIQVDSEWHASAPTTVRIIRDSAAPDPVEITSPGSNPYASGASSATLAGNCEPTAIVWLTGATSEMAVCSTAGSFSFETSEVTTDGTYEYSLAQTDSAGNASVARAFTWVRDTSIPAAPALTSPVSNPLLSNASSVTLVGTCVNGTTIQLSGSDTQSVACSGSAFSLTTSQSSDGTHDYAIAAVSASGVSSAQTSFQWTRDTVAPAAPDISTPATALFTSGDTTLTLSGSCEEYATVNLSEAASESMTCESSAFQFTITPSADGEHAFALTQTDQAGNTSTGASVTWVRDTEEPNAPVLTSPSTNPSYTNGSSLTLSGTCAEGDTIALSGDDSQSAACGVGGTFSFTASKTTDDTYHFGLTATDAAGNASAQTQLTWVRDTRIPSAPALTNPTSSPYTSSGDLTIAGTCESGATVTLAGDASGSAACSDSSGFEFQVPGTADGTFNFTIIQATLAGNASPTTSLEWVRDSVVPATPTITDPSTNPYRSNTSSLTLAGACESGHLVVLTGADTQSQTCDLGGYSFTLAQSADGTFDYSLMQSSPSGVSSASTAFQWERDTSLPIVTLTSTPPATNTSTSATFEFSSSKSGSTFQCRLDSASFASCTSPTSYSAPSSGSHTFEIFATDELGNVGATVSYTWTQSAYTTLALYHFDSATGTTTDSGYYGNALTDSGTSAGASAQFGDARAFTAASSTFMTASSSTSLSQGRDTMSVESFVKLSSLPTTSSSMTITARSGASGQYGWILQLIRQGSKYYLTFTVSQDGTTSSTVKSSQLTLDTTNFHHYAVTWNQGSVKFYMDGTQKGSATVGTVGSAQIFDSTADLTLGKSASGEYLDGTMDEFRISQSVRWSTSFTAPSAAYTAD